MQFYWGITTHTDNAYAVAVDSGGNVYVTGGSLGYPSYQPACVTVKYDANGRFIWSQQYTAANYGRALALGSDGCIYITAASNNGTLTGWDYVTVKYRPDGTQAWERRFFGFSHKDDEPAALAVDGDDNVIVTGYSTDNASQYDFATIKYDTNGNQLWLRRYNGPGNNLDRARALTLDAAGCIYVTGESLGTDTSHDFATVKYLPDGTQAAVWRYNGRANGYDYARSVAVSNDGSIYVTGDTYASATKNDWFTVKYSTAAPPSPAPTYAVSGRVRRASGGWGGVTVRAGNAFAGTLTGGGAPQAAIPDGDGSSLEYVQPFASVGNIVSVSATINLVHEFHGDLCVTLVHPDGTEVLLHNAGSGSGSLIATYPDTRAPAGDLASLVGKPIGGDWKLRVRDTITGYTGTLESWSLSIYGGGVNASATTADDGTYTITGLTDGTYTVHAEKAGFTFSPPVQTVAISGANQSGIDFERVAAWTAQDVAQSGDGSTRLLMVGPDELCVQKWTGTMEQGPPYAVPAGWSPVALAADAVGNTYLLLKNGTVSFQIWIVNAANTRSAVLPARSASGWTPTDVSVGSDGAARVLLVSPTGQMRLACVSGSTIAYGPIYKASAGWTPASIGTGADNKTRVLLRNGTAAYQIWTMTAASTLESNTSPRTSSGWTARELSQSGDGSTRVLLVSPTQQVRLVNQSGTAAQVGPIYAASTGWSVVGVSADPDSSGLTRLLWRNQSGMLSLWTMRANGSLQNSAALGTY